MEGLTTITEYQLLYLARAELLRRLDRLSKKDSMSRRDIALSNMYGEQVAEINERMTAINTAKED